MAATEETTMTFNTFVDETYEEYKSIGMDGTRGLRASAAAFLGDKLPLKDSGLITKGIPSTDINNQVLREAYSLIAIHPTLPVRDKRLVSSNQQGDLILATALVSGGPLGKTLYETITSKESSELVSSVQRIASRTALGGETTRISNLIRSKGLAKYTGNILSPSALLGIIPRDTENARIAEIHPGLGELLLASALTDTITYRGLETDTELLPERYEPKAGSVPPRDDIRGVLDVVESPSDPDRVILTNDPDELGDDLYDVVVLRQPRSESDIELAIKIVKPDGQLVIIPGENPRSKGKVTSSILSGPLPGMSYPETIGIQTLTQEFVGAVIYHHTKETVLHKHEPDTIRITKQISHDNIKGIPFINAGKNRIPALCFTSLAISSTEIDAIVLQAPRNIINSNINKYISKATGKHIYLVETNEDAKILVKWLKTKGVRVMTDNELSTSKMLSNLVRTTTNTIIEKFKRSKRGKYTRPNTIITYGGCPVMISAVSEAFPDATIHVVLPPRDCITHSTMNELIQRGYGKVSFRKMIPGESPIDILTTMIKKYDSQLVWNTSWGKHSSIPTPTRTMSRDVSTAKPSSGYITLNTLLSPSHTSITTPYNLISTSLFKMADDKQYKSFKKYVDGIGETIKIVEEYLLKHNFVFRLYVDDSITTDLSLFGTIMDMAKTAEFVEIVEYNAPQFKPESDIGHISTFGTLVRLMPVFDFPHSGGGTESPDEVGIVCVRDLDIHHTSSQSYDNFFEFLRNDDIYALAYTNGYNPHHLRKVPRNHHEAVYGTGSVSFRTRLDHTIFNNFLTDILNPKSSLQTDIIKPSIEESRREKTAEGSVYYGIDEVLLNYVILPRIPADKLMKVLFYDEPYYLIGRIHNRYVDYENDEQRRTGRSQAIRDLRGKTPETITTDIKQLMEENKIKMPIHEYEHNKNYDIHRTYENIML